MSELLSIREIKKTAKHHFWAPRKTLLSEVSFGVSEGEVLGLVGHNGAGKTTLFKIILGLAFPDKGTVGFSESMGNEPSQYIGYLPENPYFYRYLTAMESLSFYAGLFQNNNGQKSVNELANLLLVVGLPEDTHRVQLGKFSKGMLQRFGMAQALVNNPRFLILDEPMSGLDPAGRRDFRELIIKLKEEGKTILFSTHILDDVQRMCDRVLLLDHGSLLGNIRMDQIGRNASWAVQFEEGEMDQGEDSASGVGELNALLKDLFDRGGAIAHIEKVAEPLEGWIEDKKMDRGNI